MMAGPEGIWEKLSFHLAFLKLVLVILLKIKPLTCLQQVQLSLWSSLLLRAHQQPCHGKYFLSACMPTSWFERFLNALLRLLWMLYLNIFNDYGHRSQTINCSFLGWGSSLLDWHTPLNSLTYSPFISFPLSHAFSIPEEMCMYDYSHFLGSSFLWWFL